MLRKIFLTLTYLVFISAAHAADEYMSAGEIKALFSGQSWDVHNVLKGKDVEGYATADGVHNIYIPWKNKVSKRKWWVEGNRHCTSHPVRGDNCKYMKDMGDGIYHGFSNKVHTHTLKNFKKGPRDWY